MPDSTDISIRDFPDRAWGVELEMMRGVDINVLVTRCRNALIANDISREVRSSPYHHDGPENRIWKWKPDGSCGHELCSPVLVGWRGLCELKVMMEAVDKYGTDTGRRLINKDCGVHVHVDCRDHDWADIKSLAMAMKIWEPIFYAMNPHSRKENRFCRPMELSMNRLKRVTNRDQISDVWNSYDNSGDRHHGLNLEPWWRRGSVEFRYFAGTWAFEKAAAGIMICVITIEALHRKGSVRLNDEQIAGTFDEIWKMAGNVGLEKFADRFFKDFLVIRGGGCPAFLEFIKFIKSRIKFFYCDNGDRRQIS